MHLRVVSSRSTDRDKYCDQGALVCCITINYTQFWNANFLSDTEHTHGVSSVSLAYTSLFSLTGIHQSDWHTPVSLAHTAAGAHDTPESEEVKMLQEEPSPCEPTNATRSALLPDTATPVQSRTPAFGSALQVRPASVLRSGKKERLKTARNTSKAPHQKTRTSASRPRETLEKAPHKNTRAKSTSTQEEASQDHAAEGQKCRAPRSSATAAQPLRCS